MSQQTDRVARAMQRFMPKCGTVQFTIKLDGTEYTGNLGQKTVRRKQRPGGRQMDDSIPLVIEKRVMTKTPVPGRTVNILTAPAHVYEISSFDHDAISWTLHLVEPKQGN